MNLKFYANVAKASKLKVRKFWGIVVTSAEVREEKLIGFGREGRGWGRVGSWPPILNRVIKDSCSS